ncbi:MAG TPA: hypothetical protein VGI45_10620 [Terracidiphilus sp.]|jgi:uncharacterized membrane protein
MSFCQNCGRLLTENSSACPICATAGPAAAVAAPAPAASGLQPNMAAALAYLAGFITGIIFLVIDPFKTDRFVRFHAFQSIFFNVAWIGLWIVWMIAGMVLGAVTKGLFFLIELPINVLLMIGGFCLWAFLMYCASQGKTFKLPVIGAIAAKQAGL